MLITPLSLTDFASGKGGKDASATEDCEEDECRSHAFQENRIIGRGNLTVADVNGKYQNGNAHAEHLPCQPHGSKCS